MLTYLSILYINPGKIISSTVYMEQINFLKKVFINSYIKKSLSSIYLDDYDLR